MEFDKINIFPIEVFKLKSNIDLKHNIDVIKSIQEEFYYRKDSGGYQGGFDLNNLAFTEIKHTIESAIKTITDKKFEVLEIWGSILTQGDWNKIHNHPPLNPLYYNSDLYAGILYLQTNGGTELTIHSNQNVTDTYNVPVNDGDILMLKSSTYHSVNPNEKESERICIAFNFKLV